MSTLFLRTLRDDPADAEVPSHRLLVRAGYIRRAAPGGFTWLPLGWLTYQNVERIVREEMNAAGFLGNLLLSTDSTVFVKPPASQYGYQNTYLFRVFKPKLEDRFGKQVTEQLLRDNVAFAYRRGDNVS